MTMLLAGACWAFSNIKKKAHEYREDWKELEFETLAILLKNIIKSFE